VAHVQQIKAAVGQDDFLSARAPGADLFSEIGSGKNLLRRG